MAITLTDNEYFAGLTDLACVLSMEKDLNNFEKCEEFIGFWEEESLPFGSHIIRRHVTLPNVEEYSETSTLLTVKKPSVVEKDFKINKKKMIPLSYSKELLQTSFTSELGINEFVSYLMNQIQNAKTNFIFKEMLNLISTTTKQTFANTKLTLSGAVSLQTVNKNNQILTYSLDELKYSQNGKNPITECVVLMNKEEATYTLVNNTQYENEKVHFFVIPKSIMDLEKKVLIIPKYALVYFSSVNFVGSFFDPSNLMVNNFAHFWICVDRDDLYPIYELTE